MRNIHIAELIDLYNIDKIDEDFKILCNINGKVIPLELIEVNSEDKNIVLYDKYNDDEVKKICKNCQLFLKTGICEYYNKEVNIMDSCSEWVF